jgi:predicted DNA-binding protein (UPF0251 family)
MLIYPVNHFVEKNTIHITTSHFLIGEEKDIQSYYKAIKKDPRIHDILIEGNMVIYTLLGDKKSSHLQWFLTPNLFFLKPIRGTPFGYQLMELGALKKETLSNFLKKASKKMDIEVISLKQEKVRDIFVPYAFPTLTEMQKKILLFAFNHGYYDFPKKTNIKKMSKALGVSQTTFQEHLRKAEKKVMPFLLENLALREPLYKG